MDPEKDKIEEVMPESGAVEMAAEGSPSEAPAPAESDVLPEAAPAEAAPKPSDAFRSRIKNAYPDQEFADDEAYFEKASKQLNDLEAYRNKNMEANKALMEIFNAEPAIPEILKDMIKGASFREAIVRHYPVEELTPQPGAPDEEGWKKNAEARANKLKENEDWNRMKEENNALSEQSIKEFADETKLSPEQAEEFLTKVGEALDEVYAGKITKSFLASMYRALNYDSDISKAKETAKIAGLNEQIETKKETKKPKGDGLPVIGGGGSPTPPAERKEDWVSNLINTQKKRQIL